MGVPEWATMSASARWLVGTAIVVVVVVVASVVVALSLGDSETEFDPGTPEATVQAYFRAIQDRDAESAVVHFTDELRERCATEELRRRYASEPDFSVRIRETREHERVTEVDVRIAVRGGASPFGEGYDVDRMIVLEREEGEWRIAEPPWPLWSCPPAR